MLLVGITKRERFIAGEDIVQQGELSTRFFVVDEGNVNFRRTDLEGFEYAAGTAGPGEFFGLPMFTTQEPAEYTADAVGQVYLYVIERKDFDALVAAHPELMKGLREIAEKRRQMTRGLAWLTEGEIVVRTTHRHPLSLIAALLPPIAAVVIVWAFVFAAGYFGLVGQGVQLIAAIIVGMVGLGWGFWAASDWADDDFIVTNKRVAHAERMPLVNASRNEIPINRIQSVIVRRDSPFEKLIGIGTLEITSAGGANAAIRFDMIPNPEAVKGDILSQQAKLRAHNQAVERERYRRRVGAELRHYVLKEHDDRPAPPPPVVVRRTIRGRASALWERLFAYELHEGDTVIWRKHWVALARQTSRWLAVVILLLGFAAVYMLVPLLHVLPWAVFPGAWSVLLIIALGGVIWEWEDWRNDLYEVTERAILDIERKPFYFGEVSKEAPLMNVQDARTTRPNAINKILNFGDVEISVAGAGPSLTFHDVARPDEIVAEVFRRLDAYQLKRRERDTSSESRLVIDALIAYHRLAAQERFAEGTGPAQLTETTAEERVLPDGNAGQANEAESSGGEVTSDSPEGDTLSEFPRVEEEED